MARNEEFDSVDTERVNNTLTPAPGSLIDAINEASDGDTIRLHSGKTYDPGEEIHVPAWTTIDFNGASIEPTSDYPVMYMDSGTAARNIDIHLQDPANYTSNIITLDGNRAVEGYDDYSSFDKQQGVELYGKIDGEYAENNEATALKFEGDRSITVGARFELRIKDVDIGVHADNTTFVQGPRMDLIMARCRIYLDQGPNCQMNTFIYGVIQNSSVTEISIRNQNGAPESGPTWWGAIWDPHVVDNAALVGSSIKVIGPQVDNLAGHNDGSARQTAIRPIDRGISLVDIGNDTEWEFENNSGMLICYRNGEDMFWLDEGQIRLFSDLDIRQQPLRDLRRLNNASVDDLATGEFAFDENRGGTGNPAWLFKSGISTVHYWEPDGTL